MRNNMQYNKQMAQKIFCSGLRDLVHIEYCLGGASDNEIMLATIDYLTRFSKAMASEITEVTELPARR